MQSITEYLEKKLKVNEDKSAVDRPWRRKFLGFSFYNKKDGVGIRVHAKPLGKFKDRVREILSRSNGLSMEQRIKSLNYLIIGWVNYFGLADMKRRVAELDEWIRLRLRMFIWKQWRKNQNKAQQIRSIWGRKLQGMGICKYEERLLANSRQPYPQSHSNQ